MNSQSNAFKYDDFELYLLDAASSDQAPSDLPARLGVALGLGVPVLAAAEMASVAPTTTSIGAATGVAEVQGVAASKGLLAAFKASFGVGSSTLWSTAAKGIAVGVLSGAAIVGSGHAIARFTGESETAPGERLAISAGDATGRSIGTRSKSRAGSTQAVAAIANAPPDVAPPAPREDNEGVEAENPADLDPDPGHASAKRRIATRAEYVRSSVPLLARPEAETEKTTARRLPRPIFPERTTAIARYPLMYDDVSALYDSPTKKPLAAATPPAPVSDPGPMIDPTELATLRTKALAQTRTLLGQSRAALALIELNGFRKRVGERHFGVDEYLLRIEALAMLGRAKEAQADVAHVERLAPNSAALRQAQMLARSRFVR